MKKEFVLFHSLTGLKKKIHHIYGIISNYIYLSIYGIICKTKYIYLFNFAKEQATYDIHKTYEFRLLSDCWISW